ncbi:unnamed protein product [Tuber aestivum]|uniref:Uncharacterized protein n=1 Tax=Tuber aestivum TaxID=59557 RepID=A0A292PTS9_9PEZI|nr:unnamed protein product [Tuber aestivum]
MMPLRLIICSNSILPFSTSELPSSSSSSAAFSGKSSAVTADTAQFDRVMCEGRPCVNAPHLSCMNNPHANRFLSPRSQGGIFHPSQFNAHDPPFKSECRCNNKRPACTAASFGRCITSAMVLLANFSSAATSGFFCGDKSLSYDHQCSARMYTAASSGGENSRCVREYFSRKTFLCRIGKDGCTILK